MIETKLIVDQQKIFKKRMPSKNFNKNAIEDTGMQNQSKQKARKMQRLTYFTHQQTLIGIMLMF